MPGERPGGSRTPRGGQPGSVSAQPLSPMTDHSTAPSRTSTLGPPVSATGTPQSTAPVKKKRIRVKTERRREQCRTNQARYRNKQNKVAQELESSVAQLRQHIMQLEAQKRALTLRINTNNPATRVAMEYSRLFGRGLAVDDHQRPPRSHLPTLNQQVQFVKSCFHHNACIGGDYGSEFFIQQAEQFTRLYGGLRLVTKGYTSVSTPNPHAVVRTNLLVEFTITRTTIQYVYPHLLTADYEHISWKLLGQRLKSDATVEFEFDEDNKVAAVE